MIGNYQWQLLAGFEYHVGSFPSQEVIVVPKGAITDLASVPRILWAVFPPHGKWAKAAIVHDWLYAEAIGSKAYADRVFLEAMEVLGVPLVRRKLMFWAVHWFGRGAYPVP